MFPFKIKKITKKEDDNLTKIIKDLSYPYESKEIDKDKNMILSSKLSIGFDTKTTRRNCNTIIFGSAGSGKTRYYTVPNLLQANCNYLVVTETDEMYYKTNNFFITQGYKVKCLNLTKKYDSMSYNPFKYLNTDIDIIKISKTIASQTESSKDPFFPKMEEFLLCAGIDYMTRNYTHSECSMELLLDIFNREEYDVAYLLDTLPPSSIGYEKYEMYKTCNESQRKRVLLSIIDVLRSIVSNTDSILKTDEMNFEDFRTEKVILYIILSPFENDINFLATLLIEQLHSYLINDHVTFLNKEEEIFANMHKRNKKQITERKELKYPLRFMLDNIENLNKIQDLEMLLAISRPYNISFSITINSISQLEALGYDKEALIGNNDTIMLFGCTDNKTAEFFSKLLPVEVVGTGAYAYNRAFMMPDELRMMPMNKCLILIRGCKPIIDDKYDLCKHKNYEIYK